MKPKLTRCPTCDFARLKLVASDFSLRTPAGVVCVPRLQRYECAQCGEVLFDYEGIKRIEQARHPKRKLSRSA